MQDPNSYVLGTDPIERERLRNQAARLLPEANWLLDQVRLQRGARAIDVGCGPLGILDLLAERVGTSGTVVGVEREPHLLNIACATPTCRYSSVTRRRRACRRTASTWPTNGWS